MKKIMIGLGILAFIGTTYGVVQGLTYSKRPDGTLVLNNPSIPVDFEFEAGNPEASTDSRTGTEETKHQLTWEGIKLACTHPGHYNNQMPPQRIKVYCKKKVCEWQTKESGSVGTERRTWYGSKVMTSKTNIHMHKRYWRGDTGPSTDTVPCTEFGYYCGKDTMDFTLTCEEVLKIPSLKDWCEEQFDMVTPHLDTEMILQGRKMHSCPGTLTGGHTQD